MSSSPTVGTLSEMDMVLSVNQAAVNKQFANLYYTPDSKNPDQNLINPVLKIYPQKNNVFTHKPEPGKVGLTAWIDPPYLDIGFVDSTVSSTGDQYKSARFNVPLKCGWADLSSSGGERAFFANWIMSWMVNLDSSSITDVETQILTPGAKAAVNDVFTTGNAQGLPSNAFLVSSVFCLFENDKIVNSFHIRAAQTGVTDAQATAAITAYAQDAENPLADEYVWANQAHTVLDFSAGGVVADPAGQDTFGLITTVMNTITTYFGDLGKDPNNPNPYVLGYAVQQTIPAPSTAIPEMVPATFFFSTTPNASLPDQSTLNFCMLGLGTPLNNANDPGKNLNAGIITTSYGALTKESAGSNGTLAFSRNLFDKQYIVKEYVSRFQVQPPVFNKMTPQIAPASVDDSGSHYNNTENFTYDYEYTDEGLDWRRIQRTGTSTLNVTWSSTLSENPTKAFSDDTARELHIQIAGSVHFNIHCWTTVKGPAGGKDGSGPWNDGGNYWADANWSASLKLNTGSDGTWAFVPSLAAQSINLPRDSSGNVVFSADHHLEGWVAFEDFLRCVMFDDMMSLYFGGMFRLTISESWCDNITNGLKALSTKVIMPAGDVFEFKGIDTDASGNVYTHLTYKSILSGTTQ
ncbi:hypothetical protein R3P38DRAFT_3049512 [Favolaschia claudopus]|uniref:Uncharacterized protein n=1 Tax=Favolaschia claudopus TaxID=2862362 RepID=A0AAW0A613_9AGAR